MRQCDLQKTLAISEKTVSVTLKGDAQGVEPLDACWPLTSNTQPLITELCSPKCQLCRDWDEWFKAISVSSYLPGLTNEAFLSVVLSLCSFKAILLL